MAEFGARRQQLWIRSILDEPNRQYLNILEQCSTLHPGMRATPSENDARCGYIFSGIYSCIYMTFDVFTGESSACTGFL